MVLRIRKVNATAKSRKIRVEITEEVLDDINALFGSGTIESIATLMTGVLIHNANQDVIDAIKTSAIL